jgi:hypothetical protein
MSRCGRNLNALHTNISVPDFADDKKEEVDHSRDFSLRSGSFAFSPTQAELHRVEENGSKKQDFSHLIKFP